ncbi:MAG TPA: response regulator transcription factor, partial [Bacteroidia bacterium]|nr:response regulator transcription factor [Bacteroidia bacterium]
QLFRDGMESLLRKVQYVKDVLHAASGNEAVYVAAEQRPDIIFMDIRMPEMNGIEATRQITMKNLPVKIIALTMMDDPHNIANMIKAGANGYLLKNTSFAELQAAIQSVMKGENYFSKDISHLLMDKVSENIRDNKHSGFKIELTPREKELVGLICRGFTNKDIADLLEISVKTVETHRNNIYSKLHVSNTADLAFFALKEGLVTRTV